MNELYLAGTFPETYAGVLAELNALQARVNVLEAIEDHMMRFGRDPVLEAVIPAKDPSQETIKVSGNNLKTVVEEVIQEWERKHPKTRSARGDVHVFLNIGESSVAVSPKDAPSGVKITEITEDRSPRHRVVWSAKERAIGALVE